MVPNNTFFGDAGVGISKHFELLWHFSNLSAPRKSQPWSPNLIWTLKVGPESLKLFSGWHQKNEFLYTVTQKKYISWPILDPDAIKKKCKTISTNKGFWWLSCCFAHQVHFESKQITLHQLTIGSYRFFKKQKGNNGFQLVTGFNPIGKDWSKMGIFPK